MRQIPVKIAGPDERIEAIAREAGLTGPIARLFVLYIVQRWPYGHPDALKEWAADFAAGRAWAESDETGREILLRLIRTHGGVL